MHHRRMKFRIFFALAGVFHLQGTGKATTSSLMQLITFKDTHSHLLQNNGNMLYAVVCKGLAGLFCKEVESSRIWGREVCDKVKAAMGNKGFFSSDELPRYGITRAEKRYLYAQCEADAADLILLYAYSQQEAIDTHSCVMEHIRRGLLRES